MVAKNVKVSLAERCLSKFPVHRTFISRMRKKAVTGSLCSLHTISLQVLESLRGGFVGNRQNPIPPFQLSEMSQGCGDASDVDHQLCSAGALCVSYWLVLVSRRWGCR